MAASNTSQEPFTLDGKADDTFPTPRSNSPKQIRKVMAKVGTVKKARATLDELRDRIRQAQSAMKVLAAGQG